MLPIQSVEITFFLFFFNLNLPSLFFLPVAPTGITDSPLSREAPASPAIATVTWTCRHPAAAIQSRAGVCIVDMVTAAWPATAAMTDSSETPSRRKTAGVS